MPEKEIKQVKTVSPPDRLTILLSLGLSVILGLGLTLMFQSTYELKVNYVLLCIGIPVYAILSVFLVSRKKIWPFFALLIATLLGCAVFYLLDLFGTEEGFWKIMTVLYQYSFRKLTLYKVINSEVSGVSISMVLLLLSFFPILFCNLVILRRKHFIFVFFWCLPYILCTIALDYMFPSMVSVELVLGAILLLLCFQSLRKMDGGQKDRTVLKLATPVFALLFILGLIFPQSSYSKNTLAEKEKEIVQSVVSDVVSLRNQMPRSVMSLFQKKKEPTSWAGSAVIKNLSKKLAVIDAGSENLNNAGDFLPPEVELFEVQRYKNLAYPGEIEYSRYLYLKSSSMGEYSDNKWEADDIDIAPENCYLGGTLPKEEQGKYALKVKMLADSKYCIMPFYTDNYTASYTDESAEDGVFKKTPPTMDSAILDEYCPEREAETYCVAYNNVPVKVGGDWSQEYLDLVYDRYLTVPLESRMQILSCDALPQWFHDVVDAKGSMTPEEKVTAVTTFITNLHPYNAETPYPPTDRDFVAWFLDNAETGYCVHYATASAILLRMLGVPTRYVSGYMVNTLTDLAPTTVYTTDAHAWFEFFTDELGWVMYDPTPGNENAMSDFGVEQAKEDYGLISSGSGMTQQTKVPEITETDPQMETQETSGQYYPDATSNSNEVTQAAKPSVSPVRSDSEDADEGGWNIPTFIWIPLLIIAGSILFALLLRLIYRLWWKRKLSGGSLNSRAHYYYRYFRISLLPYGKRPSRKIVSIAQKAAFSAGGISESELANMIAIGRRMLKMEGAKSTKLRRLIGKHLLQAGV